MEGKRKVLGGMFSAYVCISLPLLVGCLLSLYILIDGLFGIWRHLTFIEPMYMWSGSLLVSTAFLLFITYCIVLRGLWLEHECLLNLMVWFLKIATFATGLAAGLASFAIIYSATEKSEVMLVRTANQYKHDQAMAHKMDALQTELGCCGVKSYEDWIQAEKLQNYPHSRMDASCDLPQSCVVAKEAYKRLSSELGCKKFFEILKTYQAKEINTHVHGDDALDSIEDIIYTSGCLWKVLELRTLFGQFLFLYSLLLALIEVTALNVVKKALCILEIPTRLSAVRVFATPASRN